MHDFLNISVSTNDSCELYGNSVSSFGWKIKRNYKHFLDIYNSNGLDRLRDTVRSYENPKSFFEFIGSLFFRMRHYKSMLCYFDLMKTILDFSSADKKDKPDEKSFLSTLSSMLGNFMGELEQPSKLHEELSVLKSELELLPLSISKDNEVLKKPVKPLSESTVLCESAAMGVAVKIQEVKDGTDEIGRLIAAALQATRELQEKTMLLGNGIAQETARSNAFDAELAMRSMEIERLKGMVQAQFRRREGATNGIHFFPPNGQFKTEVNQSSDFVPVALPSQSIMHADAQQPYEEEGDDPCP
jgi:hypothetical protein